MSKTMTQKAPKKKAHAETFVDVLHADHERVKALFKKFEETEGKKQKQKIVHEVLTELKQRIRDVRQGPDGLIYCRTDEKDGAMLRIEPVQ